MISHLRALRLSFLQAGEGPAEGHQAPENAQETAAPWDDGEADQKGLQGREDRQGQKGRDAEGRLPRVPVGVAEGTIAYGISVVMFRKKRFCYYYCNDYLIYLSYLP